MTRAEIETQITALYKAIKPALPDDESGQSLHELFETTITAIRDDAEYIFVTEALLTRMITFYPHLTPVIPRHLLWSVGGSCLNFMEDSEIDEFASRHDQDDIRH